MCVKSMYIKLLVGTSHLLVFRETDCFFFFLFFFFLFFFFVFFFVVVVVFFTKGSRG